MIKTVKGVFCNQCGNQTRQFYTLRGKIFCSEDVGDGKVNHVYQLAMLDSHYCEECFSRMNVVFDRNKKTKL